LRRIQRTAAISGCALLALAALAACSSSSSSGGQSGATKLTRVTFVNPLASYPGWAKAQQCMDAEGAKHGIKVTNSGPTGSNLDPQVMVKDVQQATVQGAQAILVNPPDATTMTPALDAARSKGIYIGTVVGGENYPQRNFDIGTDLEQLGKVIMDGIGSKDPNAHVLSISQSSSQTVQQDVLKGFWDEAAAKYPNVKKVTPAYDHGEETNTLSLVTNALTAHPDITAIYELEGAGTNGVVAGISQKGMTGKVLLVANDAPPATQALIKSGQVYGVGIQQWCTMGAGAIDNLVALSQGKHVAKEIPTGASFVTKANLSLANNQD
jgi:ribose transport system substrate-binding protein